MLVSEIFLESALLELFDAKAEYEVDMADADSFVASTTIGGRKIQFCASNYGPDDSGQDAWEVEFFEVSDKHIGGTFGLSGSGAEVAVMNMVKKALEEFVSRYAPATIKFTADKNAWPGKDKPSNSRAQLYARMVKRYTPRNYEAIIEPEDHSTFFTLKRKDV